MKLSKRTWLPALALVALVSFVWCLNNDRLSLRNWSVPTDYSDDSPVILGYLRAAADGDCVPFTSTIVQRLGAPYAANWNDWPMPCKILIFVDGLLARWIGLMPAANLAVLLGYITAALAFFAVCRLMRFRWEWSFVGAVLFAFSYFNAWRGLHHLLFTYTYQIPFAVLACWVVAFSRGLSWRDWRPWVCLAAGASIGSSNPYIGNMFGQFMCLALVVQLLAQRRKFNLLLGVGSIGAMFVAFGAINLPTFIYAYVHGNNPLCFSRGYYETEFFALKPLELFLPPLTHECAPLVRLAAFYRQLVWFPGEMFSAYLGWVGIAGLLWMTLEGVRRIVRPQSYGSRFPAYLPLVLWVFFYSVSGGLNCMIALLTQPFFRGTNRYSTFIFALVLLFLVSRLSRRSRLWSPTLRYGVAAAVLLLGLFDQLPQRTTPAETQALAQEVESDRAFSQALETRLPARAMVFQLPVIAYPEGLAVRGALSYDMLHPFLYTKTLRFSYGADSGRPQEDWMKEVEKLPGAQMAAALQRYGFAAVCINRKGFADGGQGLVKQLAEAGCTEMIEDESKQQVCVLLHPAAKPELPPVSNRVVWQMHNGWANLRTGPGGENQTWAYDTAMLRFFLPAQPASCTCTLTGQLGSMRPRQVSIQLNGREVWTGAIAAGTAVPLNITLEGKPGKNLVTFHTDTPELPTKADPWPRGYILLNPQVVKSSN